MDILWKQTLSCLSSLAIEFVNDFEFKIAFFIFMVATVIAVCFSLGCHLFLGGQYAEETTETTRMSMVPPHSTDVSEVSTDSEPDERGPLDHRSLQRAVSSLYKTPSKSSLRQSSARASENSQTSLSRISNRSYQSLMSERMFQTNADLVDRNIDEVSIARSTPRSSIKSVTFELNSHN